jgi:hypothetical protein
MAGRASLDDVALAVRIASFAGVALAIRIAVTIFVEGAAGLLLDLGAFATVGLWAMFLVSDFFDTAMVKSSLSLGESFKLRWIRLNTPVF